MTTPAFSRTIANPLFGDKVTIVKTAAETNGAYTLIRVELAAGSDGPPLHYHTSYDECFTVIEGVLGIRLGKQTLFLEKGDRCTASAGAVHRFFNPSKTEKVVFSGLITPGSPAVETMLQVGYGLANDGLTNRKGSPKNIGHLALTFRWGDTNLPGVFSVFTPVMRWMARRAVRKGVDKVLIARYCHLSKPPIPGGPSTAYNVEERSAYCL